MPYLDSISLLSEPNICSSTVSCMCLLGSDGEDDGCIVVMVGYRSEYEPDDDWYDEVGVDTHDLYQGVDVQWIYPLIDKEESGRRATVLLARN